MSPMQIILIALGGYLLVGVVFAFVFVLFGSVRIDRAAGRSSAWVRLIFLPGAAVLWPVLAVRWMGARAAGPGADRSADDGGAQRMLHVVMWVVVGPIALGLVIIALMIGGGAGGAV
jgi:hypothetical protein